MVDGPFGESLRSGCMVVTVSSYVLGGGFYAKLRRARDSLRFGEIWHVGELLNIRLFVDDDLFEFVGLFCFDQNQ